jgi:hypothetical protein
MCKKELCIIGAAIVMVIAMVMFFPMMGMAGSLEPSAAPAPTMKTLDQIPPTWSTKLPASERFVVLADFNNEAVLDKETGLVWEKSPWTTLFQWVAAMNYCVQRQTGGRFGWHLPTVEQLSSLMDISVPGEPKLPTGHPFTVVQPYSYWSATTSTEYSSTTAYIVNFSSGFNVSGPLKISLEYIWCVRGGQGYDGQ